MLRIGLWSAPAVQLCCHTFASTAHTVLDELLEPLGACLTAEVAERLANLRAPESAQAPMEELARKSEEGTLSDIVTPCSAKVGAGCRGGDRDSGAGN